MRRFANATVLVTGGGQGLGQAIATSFASEGASVGVLDISADSACAAAAAIRQEGGRALALPCDVSSLGALQEAVAELSSAFGHPAILVNSAVYAKYGALLEMEEQVLDRMLAVGIKGVLLACRAVVPGMMAAGGGTIVNISSVVSLRGIAYTSAYAALKGAVDASTRALAVELGPHGIRVNAVSPSAIPSPMSRGNLDDAGWEERRRRIPLGFNGDVKDVTSAALFLASQEARFLNAVVLPVDGGYSAAGMIAGVDIRAKDIATMADQARPAG